MKKTITIMLVALMMLMLVSVNAAAEYDSSKTTTVQISSVSGQKGKTVEVALTVQNNPGISSMAFDISFDESKLTLTKIEFNSALGGQTGTSQSMNSPVTIQWVNAFSDWTEDGIFATLTFTISENAENNTDTVITASYNPDNIYNHDEKDVAIEVCNGVVSIIPLAGDINGDGKVNNKDVTRLFQYLANWSVSVNSAVLDVNGDGKVNNKDITRLMQYLANWDVKIYYETVHTHVYGEWTSSGESTHERVCSCGDKQLEVHAWGDGVITKAATHTEFGEETFTCSVCHATKIEKTEKISAHSFGTWIYSDEDVHKRSCSCGAEETEPHTWDEGTVIEEATVAKDGITRYTCAVCGGTKDENVSVKHTVTFYSDDQVLETQKIKHGESATAPTAPEKSGYRFSHWDKDFSNVTDDMDVHAVFVKTYTVDFVDYNYAVIFSQIVDAGESATAPADPARRNYKFKGWSGEYRNVNSDVTIQATYVKVYTVTFVDKNNVIVKTYDNVEIGTNYSDLIDVPVVPAIEGYSGDWGNKYTNISENEVISPIYTVNKYKVRFEMPNGEVIPYIDASGAHDYQEIEHGSFAMEPTPPEYMFSWNEYRGYMFTRWSCEFDRITGDTTVKAVYDSSYDKPIIAVKYSGKNSQGKLSASITLCNLADVQLYGIHFEIGYATGSGSYGFSVDNVSFNSAADWLMSGDQKLYDIEVNNKTKVLRFAWSNGDGVTIDTYGDFITGMIITPTGGAEDAFKDLFKINGSECSLIISRDGGDTFEKVTPTVVYD